ncbi:DUF2808 domain-containing protein [Stenomitos frigidus]|uniref:DUF2808 domain-containing protein n=1 Tax=Stenomitos frigidus ULC18 TaxID=2107698 RepID=A0A2T1EDE7_9CYAN|nr:DUF2808 domain-containing protein [Stenomitos frigidus]PSB30769.1 hypothetical protein C7B82_08110 [Stenomitos frigidus ULC18]
MKIGKWCFSAALVLWTTAGIGLSAQAVQLADGRTYFVQPPRFEGATATQKTAYFWGSTYYFTLTVPENAGESLQKVMIAPEDGPDRARFDVSQTEVVAKTHDRESKLPLRDVTQDPKTRAITVTFDQPVAPGSVVRIGLYATRNPDVGGVYLYGVTAYPTGEQPYGQFLGYGRIQITDRDFFRHGFF